ncbi:hypothetical protein VMCG_02167 [Cytospora schulzeri]|uniref:Uncharacterized protein n=1 Tax=Cytospora schulzeri TaxID=448051 RepID=A0A423X211_9PEZI|nr:hypothetical protein VMCG_02167 [Valsa malicola]
MPAGNTRHRAQRRKARDANMSDQEDNDIRRNTSSEDEDGGAFDDADTDFSASLIPTADPAVTSLVQSATQQMGLPCADGAALALAAMQQPNSQDAIRFLAAASVKANMDTQQLQQQRILTSNHATQAMTTADLASEGLRNSDVTYDNRHKRQDTINEQTDMSLQHLHSTNEKHQRLIEDLQNRTARLEDMLRRLVMMLLNNNADADQIAEMLRELNL